MSRRPGFTLSTPLRSQSGSIWLSILLVFLLILIIALLYWYWCCSISTPADTVKLADFGDGEIGLLIDGTQNGSPLKDKVFAQAAGPDAPVGNFTASNGKVIAYSFERPPSLRPDVVWTDDSDTVDVQFWHNTNYSIPVYVWILKDPDPSDPLHKWADDVMDTTLAIWQHERQGLDFSVFQVTDMTADRSAGEYLQFSCNTVQANGANTYDEGIKGIGPANPTGINVYYVHTVDSDDGTGALEYNGVFCPRNGVIVMGRKTSDDLLAHEIGHALNLAHIREFTDWESDFGHENVMDNATPDNLARKFLTEGQTVRATVSHSSFLNQVLGFRPVGSRLTCNHQRGPDGDCPGVAARIWPDVW